LDLSQTYSIARPYIQNRRRVALRDLKVGHLGKALELARAKDWTIVDMAADWNIVFPFQRDTAGT
jgi:hypothetical protein